jgi:hypothetical protein
MAAKHRQLHEKELWREGFMKVLLAARCAFPQGMRLRTRALGTHPLR